MICLLRVVIVKQGRCKCFGDDNFEANPKI